MTAHDDPTCEQACFVAWVTRLIRAERMKLAAVARAEGLHDHEALDAVQDALITFIGMPEAAAVVGRDSDGGRLLMTVVKNAARNARRRHHRSRPHDRDVDDLPVADDIPARVERAEQRLAMSACVASLEAGARRVVMLRLIDELSGDEVASALDTSPGNVAVMLHRAKEKLRACLAAVDVTPP